MAFYPYNPNLGQTIQGEPGATPVDRGYIAHYQAKPKAAGAATVLAATAQDEDDPTVVTVGITQPDVPRTLTVKGNAAGITGNVVIVGTDAAGQPITDTIALNATTEVEGALAFRSVTKITLPKYTTAGDKVSVGWGKKLGLPHIVYNAACLLVKLFNGSADNGTLAVDAVLAKNLFALDGTPDGAKVVDLFYIV